MCAILFADDTNHLIEETSYTKIQPFIEGTGYTKIQPFIEGTSYTKIQPEH